MLKTVEMLLQNCKKIFNGFSNSFPLWLGHTCDAPLLNMKNYADVFRLEGNEQNHFNISNAKTTQEELNFWGVSENVFYLATFLIREFLTIF